jgi:predicted HTH transcriptional regulator
MRESEKIEFKRELNDSFEQVAVGFSIPRNKEIIRIFKDLKFVEQLGSGLPRILKYYPQSCFAFSDNFLKITLPIKGGQKGGQAGGQKGSQAGGQKGSQAGGQKGGQKNTQIELTKKQEQVLKLLQTNPKISREELSKQLEINPSAIQKHIENLKQKKAIKRIGGDKGGYWKIEKQD